MLNHSRFSTRIVTLILKPIRFPPRIVTFTLKPIRFPQRIVTFPLKSIRPIRLRDTAPMGKCRWEKYMLSKDPLMSWQALGGQSIVKIVRQFSNIYIYFTHIKGKSQIYSIHFFTHINLNHLI